MADYPNPRLEARGYALMATRRALTQTLAGLDDAALWQPIAGVDSLGGLAREAWEQEFYWLWPPEIPAPRIDPEPPLTGVLYALVRHRGVTEEMLMRSEDTDLDKVYVSESRMREDAEPRKLSSILDAVMQGELFAAGRAQTLRLVLEPGWEGSRESWDNAVEAVAASRSDG